MQVLHLFVNFYLWEKSAFPEFNLFLISSRMQFCLFTVVPTNLNFATLSQDIPY
jgi:hypothetical protein